MVIKPSVEVSGTANTLEIALGIKFKGPGLYLCKGEKFYVIVPRDSSPTSSSWFREYPPETVFRCGVYNHWLEDTVFHESLIPVKATQL